MSTKKFHQCSIDKCEDCIGTSQVGEKCQCDCHTTKTRQIMDSIGRVQISRDFHKFRSPQMMIKQE